MTEKDSLPLTPQGAEKDCPSAVEKKKEQDRILAVAKEILEKYQKAFLELAK